ncbi:MAG: universal stress protein [Thermomicrobiales bacterium]
MQSSNSALPKSLDCILLPTDGTEFSDSIIDHASDCRGAEASAHLLRVLESPGWGASAFDAGLVSQYIEASREMSEQHLEALGGKLKEHGYEVSSELRDGGAADQILDCAKSCGADMIAMATHGRGGIGRLILGSVANRVLQHTTVPLLLIHPSVEK